MISKPINDRLKNTTNWRDSLKNLSVRVKVTLAFILLNAVFWLGFAVVTVYTRYDSGTGLSSVTWIWAALAILSALALAGAAFLLRRRNKLAYYFALLMLGALVVLSLTDQVGLLDIFSLLISLVPFILLIWDRKWYLRLRPDDA
jgi:hypothetical protein